MCVLSIDARINIVGRTSVEQLSQKCFLTIVCRTSTRQLSETVTVNMSYRHLWNIYQRYIFYNCFMCPHDKCIVTVSIFFVTSQLMKILCFKSNKVKLNYKYKMSIYVNNTVYSDEQTQVAPIFNDGHLFFEIWRIHKNRIR